MEAISSRYYTESIIPPKPSHIPLPKFDDMFDDGEPMKQQCEITTIGLRIPPRPSVIPFPKFNDQYADGEPVNIVDFRNL